jgi:hypothetical protein
MHNGFLTTHAFVNLWKDGFFPFVVEKMLGKQGSKLVILPFQFFHAAILYFYLQDINYWSSSSF